LETQLLPAARSGHLGPAGRPQVATNEELKRLFVEEG